MAEPGTPSQAGWASGSVGRPAPPPPQVKACQRCAVVAGVIVRLTSS
jgi:hypothetical protein